MALSVVGAGGGGGLPPGMTADPHSAGGYVFTGALTALGGMQVSDGTPTTPTANSYDAIDASGNETNVSAGGLAITRATSGFGVYIQQADGQTHPAIIIYGSGFARVLRLEPDGRLQLGGGAGLWGQDSPATQAVLATGAGATVDDVITLLQSYGLCKQA